MGVVMNTMVLLSTLNTFRRGSDGWASARTIIRNWT